MKTILIDAEKQSITEVNSLGDRSAICDLLQSEDFTIGAYDADTFDTLYIDPIAQTHLPGFTVFRKKFYGRGVILGTDFEGENTSIETKVKDLHIKFIAQ